MSLEVKNKGKTYIVWNRNDKEFSFGYPDLTEQEVKTIMRIINISKSPRHKGFRILKDCYKKENVITD
jgi:hypothetical protein